MITTDDLVLTQSAVLRGGRQVGRLLWSGRCLKVESLRGRGLGRLLPSGYTLGRPDDGSGLYDAWTAKHPHVHTPSDTIIGDGLELAEGVALILKGSMP
jgi:hypothetical protein